MKCLLRTGVSTWGCAVNCTQDIVATSSNSHNIDVLYPKAQNPRSNSPEESSEISLDPEVHEFNGNVDVLRGHGHNVPNIAFSAGGGYIASASIDQTHGSDEHYISDLEGRQIEADDLDEAGGEGEEDDGNHAADDEERVGAALLYDEMPDETSSSDSAELDTNRYNQQLPTEHAIDHETDIQNGYINTGENASVISEFGTHEHRSTLSPEIGMRSEDSAPAENSQLRIRAESDFIQEDTDPSQSPALLLCGTKSDLLLLDPSNAESPIVDKIEYVVSRTPMPTLMDMLAFDRVTFLEWVPELAVAVVGALTGVVSIVRFECTPSGDGAPRYKMRVLAYIPAKSHASPLYGISVYRKHVDCSQFPSVVLYLLYVDGDLAAHEMRLPPLNLTESLFPH
ncbi:hypothetical protein IWW48_000122 [Coemansia sp. RSA 1200]|nr:hypothetical protein IWW48_000122 [Coemansia sp. RSA 1200]